MSKDQVAIRIAIHGYLKALKNIFENNGEVPPSLMQEHANNVERFKRVEGLEE